MRRTNLDGHNHSVQPKLAAPKRYNSKYIVHFLIINEKKINTKEILILLEKLYSKKQIISLLDKIDNFIIKEEELFNKEKDLKSFQLLEGIKKGELFSKHDLNRIIYFFRSLQNKQRMFNKIINYEINFNSLEKCYNSKARQEIFEKKLKILLFNDNQDFGVCIDRLRLKFRNIFKIIEYINKLLLILKEFFPKDNKNNIIKIEKLRDLIQNGMMKEIERSEVKNELEEIYKILSEENLEKIEKLRKSFFL